MNFESCEPCEPQPYQYFGYPRHAALLSPEMVIDDVRIYQSLEESINPTFPFNEPFVSLSLGLDAGLTNSTSTQTHHLSLISNFPTARSLTDLDHSLPFSPNRRDSSEYKSQCPLTPAQSRRKAQNRAAQRAFRERKERHVRDLESKLHSLTSTITSLQAENAQLRRLLHKAAIKNKMLRAGPGEEATTTKTPSGRADSPKLPSTLTPAPSLDERTPPLDTSLPTSAPFPKAPVLASPISSPDTPTVAKPPPASLETPHTLSAPQTWELLQSHPRFLAGEVDLREVCKSLAERGRVVEGRGVVWEEGEVRGVVEGVARGDGARRRDEVGGGTWNESALMGWRPPHDS